MDKPEYGIETIRYITAGFMDTEVRRWISPNMGLKLCGHAERFFLLPSEDG